MKCQDCQFFYKEDGSPIASCRRYPKWHSITIETPICGEFMRKSRTTIIIEKVFRNG